MDLIDPVPRREAILGTWALIQLVFDIFLALGLFIVIMRMSRAPKDDPRLSRGLQLLQSKISVLEDLSDRTESQVSQLTAILEQKAREVQAKVQLAEQHVQAIKVSMEHSLEVAKIFQDKIPHQEIIERQNTVKYVQAARLAHQGLSADEIAAQVDLPKGEIEFIAKVNRDQLMFSEEQLPTWAKQGAVETSAGAAEAGTPVSAPAGEDHASRLRVEMQLAERQKLVENLSRLQFEMQNLDMQLAKDSPVRDMASAFEVPQVSTSSLQKLGEEFRKACEVASQTSNRNPLLPPLDQLTSLIPQVFNGMDAGHGNPEIFMPQTSAPAAAAVAAPIHANAHQVQPPNASQALSAHAAVPANGVTASASASASAAVGIESESAGANSTDPMLARAVAQAKVQAALRSGAPQAKPQSEVSPELAAARAMAKEMAAATAVEQGPVGASVAKPVAATAAPVTHVVNGRGVRGEAPVVKKVQFPKIEVDR